MYRIISFLKALIIINYFKLSNKSENFNELTCIRRLTLSQELSDKNKYSILSRAQPMDEPQKLAAMSTVGFYQLRFECLRTALYFVPSDKNTADVYSRLLWQLLQRFFIESFVSYKSPCINIIIPTKESIVMYFWYSQRLSLNTIILQEIKEDLLLCIRI